MGVQGSNTVVTPGIKSSLIPEEDDPVLKPEMAAKFRRVVARGNFLCQDRMDIQYATKKLLANPTGRKEFALQSISWARRDMF